MLPDRVSNPGPLTYESGALPIALRGPAWVSVDCATVSVDCGTRKNVLDKEIESGPTEG